MKKLKVLVYSNTSKFKKIEIPMDFLPEDDIPKSMIHFFKKAMKTAEYRKDCHGITTKYLREKGKNHIDNENANVVLLFTKAGSLYSCGHSYIEIDGKVPKFKHGNADMEGYPKDQRQVPTLKVEIPISDFFVKEKI